MLRCIFAGRSFARLWLGRLAFCGWLGIFWTGRLWTITFGRSGIGRRCTFYQHLFRPERLHFSDVALGFFGSGSAVAGLIPIVGVIVLDVDLRFGEVCASRVDIRVNQSKRHLGHARRLAIAGADENHIFHARAAQAFGRLLAQYPGDGVRDIRFAAAIRSHDGSDAVTLKLQFGAVTKRFEPEDL